MSLVPKTLPSSNIPSEILHRKLEQNMAFTMAGNTNCGLILRVAALQLSRKEKTKWEPHSDAVGWKRGLQTVMFATATETDVTATEPLTKEDLVEHLASGCKPKEKWRCTSF